MLREETGASSYRLESSWILISFINSVHKLKLILPLLLLLVCEIKRKY